MINRTRNSLGTGLLLAWGCICLSPSAATAQNDIVPPLTEITSPAPGATVSAGLILRAVAVDDVAVAGVRFLVDGVPIGSETSTHPYWTAWDTTALPEGTHTLSVVARDAAGNTGTSSMTVTVDRTPPALQIISPSAAEVVLDIVTIAADVVDSGGVARVSFSANGVPLGDDLTPPYAFVWDTSFIPDGPYELTVSAEDRAGGLNTVVVNVAVANGTTRIEETDPAFVYSGTWAHGNDHRSWSGGTAAVATLTMFSARAALTFTGTGVSWIGFRGPQCGIANVYLDGVHVATVDLFDPIEHLHAKVFETRQLAPGSHTLVIEATGQWNPLSIAPFVIVDSVIVFQR